MPTGYTAKIADGMTFKEFAYDCCEAHVRRANLEDNDYHMDELGIAYTKLVELEALSADEIDALYECEYQSDLIDYDIRMQEHQVLREQYEAMLREVKQWVPPTENHEYFKTFMQSQIEVAMRCDYPALTDEFPPERVLPAVWFTAKLEDLKWDIEYNGRAHGNSVMQKRKNKLWVKQIEDSLDA